MRLYRRMPTHPRAETFGKRGGVEAEVGDLLYGLVRMAKPAFAIETGTYVADSTEAIGRALRDNGHGTLMTCDVNPEVIQPARDKVAGLPVEVYEKSGEELIGTFNARAIGFAFVDSGLFPYRARELELLLFEDKVTPGGLVCFHDVCGDQPWLYDVFEKSDWPHLVLPSVVGIAVFQRPYGN